MVKASVEVGDGGLRLFVTAESIRRVLGLVENQYLGLTAGSFSR